MRIFCHRGFIVLGAVFCLLVASPAFSQFEEEIFFGTGDWIETAAKRLQRIEESPAAVTVITAEEIKKSGAITLCDVLRMVPGIEVLTISVADCQVGARGQNKPASNGVLALVNGRSIYEDIFGNVVWTKKDFPLEQIERIEVVRGPGSVLYGANAFHAVVNIITKDLLSAGGDLISLTAGEDAIIGTVVGSAQTGAAEYLLSAGWTQFSQYGDPENIKLQYPRGRMHFKYDLEDLGQVRIEAGVDGGDYELLQEMLGMFKTYSVTHNVMAKYEIKDFYVRTFWNSIETRDTYVPDPIFDGEEIFGFPISLAEGFLIDLDLESHVVDLEAQKIQDLGWGNLFTVGASSRFISTKYDLSGVHKYGTDLLFAAYLQHEFTWETYLHSYLGVRWDHHPRTGENFSPRASLLVTPLAGHAFRFSGGKSFRNPTFIEQSMDIIVPLMVGPMPASVGLLGNPDLGPEELISYEAGYQSSLFKGQLKLGVNVFYNEISGLIGPDFPFDLDLIVTTGVVEGGMGNVIDEEAVGVEVEVKYRPKRWLSVLGNFTWTQVDDLSFDEKDRRTPEYKVNGGVMAGPYRGISTSVLVHYYGETFWPYSFRSPEVGESLWFLERGEIPAYTLVNFRLAYRFLREHFEASVNVFNLLDKEHYEIPYGDEIGRRIMGTLCFTF